MTHYDEILVIHFRQPCCPRHNDRCDMLSTPLSVAPALSSLKSPSFKHTLTLFLTRTLSPSLSRSLSLFLFFPFSLSLVGGALALPSLNSLSQTHTSTHTLSLSRTHTCTHTHLSSLPPSLTPSLLCSHPLARSLARSFVCSLFLFVTLSLPPFLLLT